MKGIQTGEEGEPVSICRQHDLVESVSGHIMHGRDAELSRVRTLGGLWRRSSFLKVVWEGARGSDGSLESPWTAVGLSILISSPGMTRGHQIKKSH